MGRDRDGRSHARREEVVDTAARMFFEKGYEATSIQDIAAELGMLKGSLYYYISSKNDLLFEIIDGYHEQTRSYFRDIVAADDPVLVKLRRLIVTETAHTATHVERSSLFYSEWRSLSQDRQEVILAARDEHDQFVVQCIQEAQALGQVRPQVDPRVAALAILGMVNSVYRWFKSDGSQSAAEIGETFADLILDGLTTRG